MCVPDNSKIKIFKITCNVISGSVHYMNIYFVSTMKYKTTQIDISLLSFSDKI